MTFLNNPFSLESRDPPSDTGGRQRIASRINDHVYGILDGWQIENVAEQLSVIACYCMLLRVDTRQYKSYVDFRDPAKYRVPFEPWTERQETLKERRA